MTRWDKYFLDLCNTVASNSQCLSRKVGAIIVKDKSIIATGYNGPPRGIMQCDQRIFHDARLREIALARGVSAGEFQGRCPRYVLGFKSGEGLDWCIAGHGERNAIVNAAREGICVKGTTMYMNCMTPCTPCLVEIINAGIKEVVIIGVFYYDLSAEYLVKNSNLIVRTYE